VRLERLAFPAADAHDGLVSADVLTVLFDRWSDLAAQGTHVARGGLFVPAPEPLPKPYDELTVVVVAPDDRSVEVRARVVQIAPGVGVALASDQPREMQSALGGLLELAQSQVDAPTAAGTMVHWGRPAWDGAASAPAEDQGGELEPLAVEAVSAEVDLESDAVGGAATLYEQIRGMSSTEKLRLALHGDRSARLLLLKDPNKTIQLHILQNKRITIEEVQHIAGNRQANPEALVRIGETREWLQNPSVVLALVSNPKTPSRTAVRLLRSLPQSEIRRIAKSPNVSQSIAQAARRLVAGG
jgi:hypothetical protein